MGSFDAFRRDYPEFIYHGFQIEETEDALQVIYHFEITGLSHFHPAWRFPKERPECFSDDPTVEHLLFSIGLVELISYWKITCSPNVRIEAGTLCEAQIDWWKKQYFFGLGEFFYKNGISTDFAHFMTVTTSGKTYVPQKTPRALQGAMIPVGGGKDSIVTMELLKDSVKENRVFLINRTDARVESARLAGYRDDQITVVSRTLDENMLELNRRGFLNGHTPFSALIAFSATLAAVMTGKKYVILSNESSADENTVEGTDVNHQYSKSFAFERDFHEYEEKYIASGTYYFSLLRPWSEFQIARYFSNLSAYHRIFRSCNAGSKKNIWCADCAKCLFIDLILSPFLSPETLLEIFGKDLTEEEKMLPVFDQLIGLAKEKPFECVGSRAEINTALILTLGRYEEHCRPLPLLLRHYKTTELYSRYKDRKNPYDGAYREENLLPDEFVPIVKNAGRKDGTKW